MDVVRSIHVINCQSRICSSHPSSAAPRATGSQRVRKRKGQPFGANPLQPRRDFEMWNICETCCAEAVPCKQSTCGPIGELKPFEASGCQCMAFLPLNMQLSRFQIACDLVHHLPERSIKLAIKKISKRNQKNTSPSSCRANHLSALHSESIDTHSCERSQMEDFSGSELEAVTTEQVPWGFHLDSLRKSILFQHQLRHSRALIVDLHFKCRVNWVIWQT